MSLGKEQKIIFFCRAFLLFFGFALILWIFFANLVPSGKIVLVHKKGDPGSKISDLHPDSRVIYLEEDGSYQRFFSDPVYFDAKVPRDFDKVVVEIIWQNQYQPILELGSRKTRDAWGFVLKPLENKILDNISWPCERYGDVLFCQKIKKYENLGDFLAQEISKTAYYNYEIPNCESCEKINEDTDLSDYDYVIASYVSPEDVGFGRKKKKIEFDWKDFDLYINEISFLISAPGIERGRGQVVLEEINITLNRDPLDFDGFVEYVKANLRRLKK